jgi:peptidoglycan/xylan/chitin deacetylase (PgdA/CDA1 family)
LTNALPSFFVNGDNYGQIYNYNSTLQRMIIEGHQIGHHTWSHADLQNITSAEIKDEVDQLNVALQNIIGGYPKYFRPPYLSYNDAIIAQIASYGMYIINEDIDTLDWQYGPEGEISTSETRYVQGITSGGTISLEHDPEPITASTLGM